MKHINIPIFIPHLGCPNRCIFCNQRYISGTTCFDENSVDEQINRVLSTVSSEDECEIAFFGGSFTGIDRNLMIRLLDKAQKYVNSGMISSIRMSTRPDYISDEIISILQNYSISCVELGIQSMNDKVLSYLKRGHTVHDTEIACQRLKNAGFSFVGQMMVGLPTSTVEDEIYCAKRICKLGASGSRIYPTIVFKDTELMSLLNDGAYTALTIEQAVDRSAKVLDVFVENNVPCIRIGLCDSENLHSKDTYVDGPNSPALGEMVKSRVYLNRLTHILNEAHCIDKEIKIFCPNGATSQVVGHKKVNITKLKDEFGIKHIKIIEKVHLDAFEVEIERNGGNTCD